MKHLCLMSTIIVSFIIFTSCASISEEKKQNLRSQGYPIAVLRISNSSPDFLNGVNVSIIWQNISEKDIKYVHFSVIAFNRVDDEVKCTITDEFRKNLRSVGPFKKGSKNDDTWESVWYNNSINYVKIRNIKITFMDNSIIEFDKEKVEHMFAN